MRIIKVRYLAATNFRGTRLKYINATDNKTVKIASREYSIGFREQIIKNCKELNYDVVDIVFTDSTDDYVIVK